MKARPGSLLFVSDSEQHAASSIPILLSAGYQVSRARSVPDAQGWLRIHRADLVLLCLEEGGGEAVRWGAPLLWLTRARDGRQLRDLFKGGWAANFISVGPDGKFDPVELTVTVSKILTKDIFGSERYLARGARLESHRLADSTEKPALVDRTRAFAIEAGCAPRIAEQLGVAADELITNVIYNGPVDSSGARLFSHLPRTTAVSLADEQAGELRLGFDGRRLCLSTCDPFGSLDAQKVLDYLARCFGGGEQIELKDGGAGLGLYFLFQILHHFVVNIAPGKRTEVIGLIEVTSRYRDYAAHAKSFNVFVAS
ncbi:MAG: hypothetical protein ACYCWW_01650 [Deltaproteobacteria bacterium]